MNDKRPTGRRPAAFAIPEEPAAIPARSAPRPPSRHTDGIILTPDADDPFAATTVDLKALPPVATPHP